MKKYIFVLILSSFSVFGYDEYNILVDNDVLNKDEVQYFKQNCKNAFSYTCIAISQKIKEAKQNGK